MRNACWTQSREPVDASSVPPFGPLGFSIRKIKCVNKIFLWSLRSPQLSQGSEDVSRTLSWVKASGLSTHLKQRCSR